MTEIKLTKRYPNSRTEDITDAYMRGWNDALDAVQNGKFHIADTPQTDSEVTRNSLRTDCTGCKFVGWYDTEFPCVNCIRKNKDYYTSEQTDCPWK
jgi:hypothetical protein